MADQPFGDGGRGSGVELSSGDESGFEESARSSVFEFREENGRTYHGVKDGAYLLPNDWAEQDRLEILHQLFTKLLEGKLYLAPISHDLHQVLDVGTGTGAWAIDFGDQFASANVQGIDLSPIQPTSVPPNVIFYVEDAEGDHWSYKTKFDLIHCRALCGVFANWPKFYAQAYKNLQPGGYMETQDYACQIYSNSNNMGMAPNCAKWMQELESASTEHGKTLNIAHKHRKWMIDAGFEDVTETIRNVPIGEWTENSDLHEIGQLLRSQMKLATTSFTLAHYSRILKYNIESIHVFMAYVNKELSDDALQLYMRFHFVYGRKPMGLQPENQMQQD
ncbi:hypothetical protein H2204_002359 [Knufia peltigerae]|nr:hypothetical protein H2204_002359 [Knufia peltigerae]